MGLDLRRNPSKVHCSSSSTTTSSTSSSRLAPSSTGSLQVVSEVVQMGWTPVVPVHGNGRMDLKGHQMVMDGTIHDLLGLASKSSIRIILPQPHEIFLNCQNHHELDLKCDQNVIHWVWV